MVLERWSLVVIGLASVFFTAPNAWQSIAKGIRRGASRSLTQRLSFDESLSFFAPIGAMVNSDGLPARCSRIRQNAGWWRPLGLPAFWRTRLRRRPSLPVASSPWESRGRR